MSDDLMRALAHQATMDRVLEVLRVPKPLAGAQWSFALPNDRVYRVRGVTALLTTSAVVGTRVPAVTFDDQASIVAAAVANLGTAASLAVTYAWNPGGATAAVGAGGGFVSAKLPELILPGGYEIKSACTAFDVGDQWSNIVVWVETLLTQPTGVHEYRDALQLAERVDTSPFLQEVQQ